MDDTSRSRRLSRECGAGGVVHLGQFWAAAPRSPARRRLNIPDVADTAHAVGVRSQRRVRRQIHPRGRAPMANSQTVTIVFCDLVGSTALMTRLGDDANDRLRRRMFASLRGAVAAYRGEEVKTAGD